MPRRTIFIKGNHEDFGWLDDLRGAEALPGLVYLPNGHVHELEDEAGTGRIRIGGIGGCFGPSNYDRPSARLQGYARRHFTRDEVERLCAQGRLDILLLHDAPGGVEFVRRRGPREQHYVSEAAGLAEAGCGKTLIRDRHETGRVIYRGHARQAEEASNDVQHGLT